VEADVPPNSTSASDFYRFWLRQPVVAVLYLVAALLHLVSMLQHITLKDGIELVPGQALVQ
jgi:hypothetical protein